LVTFETLCWTRKHVLSNLGSLTGVYSCFSSCPKKVAVTFGCSYLTQSIGGSVLVAEGMADRHIIIML
jgi:hypothetical protein